MKLVEKCYRVERSEDTLRNCPFLKEGTRKRLEALDDLQFGVVCRRLFDGDYIMADEFDLYVNKLLDEYADFCRMQDFKNFAMAKSAQKIAADKASA